MGTAFTASEAPVESWKLQDVKPRIVLTVPQPIKQENSRNGSVLATQQLHSTSMEIYPRPQIYMIKLGVALENPHLGDGMWTSHGNQQQTMRGRTTSIILNVTTIS